MRSLTYFLTLFVLLSCKKESQLTDNKSIVAQKWTLKSFRTLTPYQGDIKEPAADFGNWMPYASCYENSNLSLAANGKFEFVPGRFTCANPDFNTQIAKTGIWKLTNGTLSFISSGESAGVPYKITSLTKDKLEIQRSFRVCIFSTNTTLEVKDIIYSYQFVTLN